MSDTSTSQKVSAGTLLMTDPRFLEHDTGVGHPECPQRLSQLKAFIGDCDE